jgi:hypothetical protein
MSTNYEQRNGFKWTVNECLRLQREFELLNLPVQEIALLHKRSPYAIMYKLDSEGIADFNELYQQTYPNEECDAEEADEADEESEEADEESEEADEESEGEEADASESEGEDYDRYNLKQQVIILTKQLSNLTAVVYKYVTGPNNVKHRSAF